MNQNMTFERMLATYMAEEASGRAPERLVDDVLSATSRTRPHPRWLALLKEPPMRTQTRVVVGMPARRLILAMAAAALLLLALLAAVVGANLLKPPQQLASDDWPMFRGDSTRAGLVLHGPKGRPVVQWQYKAQGAVTQNISIVGDTVYVPTDNGYVNAVALADGTLRWSIQLDRGPASGLIVADGLVLVRDGDGVFYGLDAAMGSRQWQSSGNAPGGANATIGPGALYVGAENGDLVAFDTKTGKERWRTAIGAGGGVNNAAYADGLVYVATQNAGFFAVDARTGAQRWRVDVGGDVTGTPVVANGIAYIGSGTDTSSGHLRAVDAKTGQSIWTLNEPIGSPSLANGIAYASAPNLGLEVAFDEKTGRELWRVKFPGGGTTRAPAIADGIVFVPQDGEHRIYALDATTGGEYWHFDLDSGNNCCIAVTKGSVFVGTDLGTVYRISGDGSTLTAGSVATVPPTASAPQPASSASSAPAGPPPGEIVWSAKLPDHGFNANGSLSIDPEGNIWVPDHGNSRFSIIAPDGTFMEHWGKAGHGDGEFILNRPNGDGYGGVAFAPDGCYFVLDTGNRRVEKFDAHRTFVKAWGKFGSSPGEYNDPIAILVGPDKLLYVLDDVRSVVEKYDLNGKVVGSFDPFSNAPGNHGSNGFTVDADGNVYVGQLEPNQVAVFDRAGKLLRTMGDKDDFQFSEQPGSIALDRMGRVFVTQGPSRGLAPGVVVFDKEGRYVTGFGPPDESELGLHFPTGMLFDASGSLILQDAGPIETGDNADGRILKLKLLPPLAR